MYDTIKYIVEADWFYEFYISDRNDQYPTDWHFHFDEDPVRFCPRFVERTTFSIFRLQVAGMTLIVLSRAT